MNGMFGIESEYDAVGREVVCPKGAEKTSPGPATYGSAALGHD